MRAFEGMPKKHLRERCCASVLERGLDAWEVYFGLEAPG